MRKKRLERSDLLVSQVPAIIDHDVHGRNLLAEPRPEGGIGLVADEHVNVLAFVRTASRLDVDPVDAAPFAEVIAPHREAASAVDADFHNMYFLSHEAGKVAVIHIEVVAPLPDTRTILMGIEVRL